VKSEGTTATKALVAITPSEIASEASIQIGFGSELYDETALNMQ
jgi:hypothetical protein